MKKNSFIYIVFVFICCHKTICQSKCDTLLEKNEVIECKKREFTITDSTLNDLYNGLVKKFNYYDIKNLQISQNAWKTVRECHCKSYVSILKASTQSDILYFECMKELTDNRIRELTTFNDIK